MRAATDQRQSADDDVDPEGPPPARLAGTDVFRGGIVILLAVAIGAFLLSRGLDEPDRATDTVATEGDLDDEAPTDETPSADTPIDGTAGADGTGTSSDGVGGQGVDQTDGGTGAMTDPSPDATGDPAAPTAAEPALRSPAEVKVLVLNGAGTQGIAARGTEMLQASSYNIAAPKNAESPARGPSAVFYIEGYEQEALAVAEVYALGLADIVQPLDLANPPIADTQGAAVIVYVGNDGRIPVL